MFVSIKAVTTTDPHCLLTDTSGKGVPDEAVKILLHVLKDEVEDHFVLVAATDRNDIQQSEVRRKRQRAEKPYLYNILYLHFSLILL